MMTKRGHLWMSLSFWNDHHGMIEFILVKIRYASFFERQLFLPDFFVNKKK